jgi:hypothetical protein
MRKNDENKSNIVREITIGCFDMCCHCVAAASKEGLRSILTVHLWGPQHGGKPPIPCKYHALLISLGPGAWLFASQSIRPYRSEDIVLTYFEWKVHMFCVLFISWTFKLINIESTSLPTLFPRLGVADPDDVPWFVSVSGVEHLPGGWFYRYLMIP